FSPRTRLLVLNTPQNPVGKVFTRGELGQIAALVQAHDVYVLSDEVYEWMVYPDPDAQPAVDHVRIATLPGMWDRTLTLGSAGKPFSGRGWKVGWAIGSAALARSLIAAHQWISFAVTTPLQDAVGAALEQAVERDYFNWLSAMYRAKRDKLLGALDA